MKTGLHGVKTHWKPGLMAFPGGPEGRPLRESHVQPAHRVGGMARADLDKQPGEVAAMFDAIAGRYDLLNDILSMGQVRLWRRAVARITGARPGERVLDLAAGTGTSSLTFTATGADCVACDFSLGMLRAGLARSSRGLRGSQGGLGGESRAPQPRDTTAGDQ